MRACLMRRLMNDLLSGWEKVMVNEKLATQKESNRNVRNKK